ncbi:4a-hydroxytetrahydrobiopterin dehydratase [Roseivivax sp. GX 12232]|uniref:4a-hydroxytetrahydrobiopterin dehydratase n=1 Tax=Roseivivax sp. GX 12232 TaxID=2900547 RepID=UPI001E32742C|nr:4a-hydroxytetrahydrobiopterin dehydratase [Roseivivax sp. GX 12232]MCE0505263.1 4a-hydroxytetrahydrobiopterin dehydratase [Roseivivax sp. GX 12232]
MITCNIGDIPKCDANAPVFARPEAEARLADLPEWQLSADGKTITRRLTVKGFAKATYLANLAIWLADAAGHHPDMALGWGYFTLSYTSHEAGGLTEADFACAAQFDALLAG